MPFHADAYLPTPLASTKHSVLVHATPEVVYEALHSINLSESLLARLLFSLRSFQLPFGRAARRLGFTIEDMLKSGFILLHDEPPREIALGLVGKFWTLDGCIQRMDAESFIRFNEPGFAKAVWSFLISEQQPSTQILITETRVSCTDKSSRRKFLRYWSFVRPFSGLIRREALRIIKRHAERYAH